MARAFFGNIPDNETRIKLLNVLHENAGESDKKCQLWTGLTDRHGYGYYRFMSNKKRIKVHVHRLAYFLNHDCQPLCSSKHVSHLCHNKLCINNDHLSYESAANNNSRKECFLSKECIGHHGYKLCRF